jgi:lysophospholipase
MLILFQILSQAGVIPGVDMTPEAALTKLSYVLSKTHLDLDIKREVFHIFLQLLLHDKQYCLFFTS